MFTKIHKNISKYCAVFFLSLLLFSALCTLVIDPVQAAGNFPPIQTIFIIVMENHNWSDINSSNAPYIMNTLLPQGAHANQYISPSNIHPSLPNYLWMEAGQKFGISDDNAPSSHQLTTADHLVNQLQAAGISWKAYQEAIPGTNCPLTDVSTYRARHNPFVYFTDVTNNLSSTSANCIAHIRPYSELQSDLTNNTVPRYVFITPDINNDMHNTNIQTGDNWLKNEIPKIMASSAYRNGGVIFLTWDEDATSNNAPIGMIVLSPYAKVNYSNSIQYTHSSLLRSVQEMFNVGPLLGGAATATNLSDFFTTSATVTPGASNTPSPTATRTPTSTPTPTNTPSRTPTLISTSTPSRTPTPVSSSTVTAQPTQTVSTCSADINLDHSVDLSDYSLLVQDFLKSPPSNPRADINQNGVVDLTDYSILVSQFLKPCSGGTATPTSQVQATLTPSRTLSPTATRTPTLTPSRTPTPVIQASPTATPIAQTTSGRLFSPTSAFNQPIPAGATYTPYTAVGSFRQVIEVWSAPITRVTLGQSVPLVSATVTSSGRTANWPIPTTANPATEADHHMIIINRNSNFTYEFWDAAWNGSRTAISAGGMKDFQIDGNGISNPASQRVVAAGFAISAGMVIKEDITDTNGNLNPNAVILHALTMAVPSAGCRNAFVAPAVGSETSCIGGSSALAMGERLALPKNTNIDALNIHPLSKMLLRAARDYGIFINDSNGASDFNGKQTGTVRIEPGLTNAVWGASSDSLISTVQSEVFNVIQQNGLYRVTGISY